MSHCFCIICFTTYIYIYFGHFISIITILPCSPTILFFYIIQKEENEIYKRNISVPTLNNHFDKRAIPRVMKVCY